MVQRSNLEPSAVEAAQNELLINGQLIPLEPDSTSPQSLPPESLVISEVYWRQLKQQLEQIVSAYHQSYPLRRGVPREELKSRLKLSSRLFNAFIRKVVDEKFIEEKGPFVAFPQHDITFSRQQQQMVAGLMAKFAASPFAPPTVKECVAEVGEDIYMALLDLGDLISVSPEGSLPFA